MNSRRVHKRRLLKEDLPVGQAAPQQTQSATTGTTDQTQQNAGEVDTNKPLFTKEDVANMSPGEIINYVYVSMPQNIDPATKQALLDRAADIRKDAETGKDVQDRARAIMRSIGSNVDIGL